jgi:hypothetical protein
MIPSPAIFVDLGCLMPEGIIAGLATIVAAAQEHERTRAHWPHSKVTWLVFALASCGMYCGLLMIAVDLALVALQRPDYWTVGSRSLRLLLDIGIPLTFLGVIGLVVWVVRLYLPAMRRFPIRGL